MCKLIVSMDGSLILSSTQGSSNDVTNVLFLLVQSSDREPMFSEELGLAVETPPDGVTLKSLWEVVPSH